MPGIEGRWFRRTGAAATTSPPGPRVAVGSGSCSTAPHSPSEPADDAERAFLLRRDVIRSSVRRAYGHRPTGLTWAMACVGTAMMPSAVRTLMASAGPLTSGPHQAWPVVPVTATATAAAGLLAANGH